MRAETIRRCLVFGVCALGVSALYLFPSLSRSSYQVGQPTIDEPTGRPTSSADAASASLTVRRTPTARQSGPSAEPNPTSAITPAAPRQTADATTGPRPERPTRGATAYEPDSREDSEPPEPVQKITPSKVTADQLSLEWPAAHDNVRVIGYHVWLSGYQVASTAETSATVRWFNDDTAQHVVQVKAVDAAGNEAETSPSLLVSRPDPGDTESPPPSDPPSTEPPAPKPSDAPSASESPNLAPADPTPGAVASGGSH